MKILNSALFCLFILIGATACASGSATKFNVSVRDLETNLALSNINVRTTFQNTHNPWGTGESKSVREQKKTDFQGFVNFAGKDCMDSMSVTVFSEHYYTGTGGFKFTGRNEFLDRWEPWNPTIDVFLRKIKDPVPMVKYEKYATEIPETGQNMGFDLEIGDWISPLGKGNRTDIIFNVYRRFDSRHDHDIICTITFPNKDDGIQKYEPSEKNKQSSFIFPYQAPISGYQPEMVLKRHRLNQEMSTNFDPDNELYLFRVRTQIDKDGNVKSACYGRIDDSIDPTWGDVLSFKYHFNPNSNSRSLEYNGTNLLKK